MRCSYKLKVQTQKSHFIVGLTKIVCILLFSIFSCIYVLLLRWRVSSFQVHAYITTGQNTRRLLLIIDACSEFITYFVSAGKRCSCSNIFCGTRRHYRRGYKNQVPFPKIHIKFSRVGNTHIFFKIYQVFTQKLHRSFENIKIISNRMLFDDNGQLVSFKGDPSTILFLF